MLQAPCYGDCASDHKANNTVTGPPIPGIVAEGESLDASDGS